MKIIAGLGNPGPEYVFSRHNAGWLVVDHLVNRYSCGSPRMQFSSMAWTHFRNGEKLLLLKPLTYMNLSGRAVREAADYFSLSWEDDVLVVYDDVPFPTGSSGCGRKAPREATRECCPSSGRREPWRSAGCGSAWEQPPERIWCPGSRSLLGKRALGTARPARPAADAVELWCTEGADKAMNTINATV